MIEDKNTVIIDEQQNGRIGSVICSKITISLVLPHLKDKNFILFRFFLVLEK